MIQYEPTKGGERVKVTFRLADTNGFANISVVGDFNSWNPASNVLKRNGDARTVSLVLCAGRTYRFRYLTDNGIWFNDDKADAYERNHYGEEDSILDLRRFQ